MINHTTKLQKLVSYYKSIYLYEVRKKAANRPLKYGEPTVPVVMRIPKSKVAMIKRLVKSSLKKWEQ